MHPSRRSALFSAAVLATAALTSAVPAHAEDGVGGRAGVRRRIRVPGAELQVVSRHDDLTTSALTGTPYTDAADWAGLAAKDTRNPSGVPGVQIDGYFPGSSHLNTLHGWNYDAQFVIRLPEDWNGGLVVTGAPGVRKQYSMDTLVSDWVLAQGYAFAATDKGNTGPDFYTDGDRPGDAVAEWNRRTTQLTRAAKAVVAQHYGRAPRRTYMTGISNSGYLTRWQLENHPELYDGGVDWEGVLWRPEGPNLLTFLPTAVARTLGQAGDEDMYRAGFTRGSEFLWPYHEQVYWGLTQKIYRAEFDPGYDPACPGASAGTTPQQIFAPCPSDAVYDYAARPRPVHDAVARISLTGRIGKPMITLHGTLDALLPIGIQSDVYARMIAAQGRSRLHRYYRVEGGNHIDSLYDVHPDRLQPILPHYRAAFTAMTAWVERGEEPPASRTIPRAAAD